MESEAEMKVAELLQDLQQIRNANEHREKTIKQAEREKTEMVATLEAHSQRLTQQLEQVIGEHFLFFIFFILHVFIIDVNIKLIKD